MKTAALLLASIYLSTPSPPFQQNRVAHANSHNAHSQNSHSQSPNTAINVHCSEPVNDKPDETKTKNGPNYDGWILAVDVVLALATLILAGYAVVQAKIMRAQFDQIADVRWSIKWNQAKSIWLIQACVVNLSSRPMTIIEAKISVQGQPERSIKKGTVIDSSAGHTMNFDGPDGAAELWKFAPMVEWSVSHEHKITKKEVPRTLKGALHFWRSGEKVQWGTSFEPRGGDDPATITGNVSEPSPTTE